MVVISTAEKLYSNAHIKMCRQWIHWQLSLNSLQVIIEARHKRRKKRHHARLRCRSRKHKVIKAPTQRQSEWGKKNETSEMVLHNLNDLQWYPLKPLAVSFLGTEFHSKHWITPMMRKTLCENRMRDIFAFISFFHCILYCVNSSFILLLRCTYEYK